MKRIVDKAIQQKTVSGVYIALCVSLLLTLACTLAGETMLAEVCGIAAFVSLTTGVSIEIVKTLQNMSS